MMNARQDRPMRTPGEVGLELWEADEDERQEGFGVPLVVEEDVQVREHIGVQQMGFVEEETGWVLSRRRSWTCVSTARKRLAAVELGCRPSAWHR